MDRKVAVTGSASGIGRAVARQLAEQGDEVIGVDLQDAEVCADLSTDEGRRTAVDAVTERCAGVLDGVIACAGLAEPGRLMVSVNYFGTTGFVEGLRGALAAAPNPRAVVTGSISGTRPADDATVAACLDGDEPAARSAATRLLERGEGHRIYPSTKSALARWLRRRCAGGDWAGAGIPLNAVAPGVVRTPMTAALFDDPGMRKVMTEAVPMPLGGAAGPEPVARALVWLADEGNTHITGQVLYCDGGAEVTLRGEERF